jgi:hypothetical protein
MNLGPLFAHTPVRGPDVRQPRELKRVSGRLASTVLDFLRSKVGQRFRASELHAYVAERKVGAPGSADRVMRMLKASGQCSYVLINRAQSLYQCMRCEP